MSVYLQPHTPVWLQHPIRGRISPVWSNVQSLQQWKWHFICAYTYINGSTILRLASDSPLGGTHSRTYIGSLSPCQRFWKPLMRGGGTVEIPCLDSSARTLSVEGGLRPMGSGNHGLLIASVTTLSITSSPCHHIISMELIKNVIPI